MSFEKVIIGNATLYRGDCLEILPTLDTVEAVVTDPPYGMFFLSNYRQEKHEPIANDESPAMLQWACEINAEHSKYIFCRWNNLRDVAPPKSFINWIKNNWSMGDLRHEHGRQSEGILFYAGPHHEFPNLRPTDIIFANRTINVLHPTEKPVDLMCKVIGWTCGVVVDPFMGSGTTGVACMKLDREFVGIEIDHKYFDVACKRIEIVQKQENIFKYDSYKCDQIDMVI